jgi:arsenate reductase
MVGSTVLRGVVMVVSARFVGPATQRESTLSNATKRESKSHSAPILLIFGGTGLLSVTEIASLQRPSTKPKTFTMTITPTIYGIANCDTVRKARKWLDAHQIAYDFVDVREQLPSPSKVSLWLEKVGVEQLVNRRSTTWRNLADSTRKALEDGAAQQILLDHPTLIKRPVLELGSEVIVGFSADRYQQHFNV